jgi:hypothetical protein
VGAGGLLPPPLLLLLLCLLLALLFLSGCGCSCNGLGCCQLLGETCWPAYWKPAPPRKPCLHEKNTGDPFTD